MYIKSSVKALIDVPRIIIFQTSHRQLSSSLTQQKKSPAGGISSHDWLQRQRNDPFVKMAHDEGYRARSAYKLIEINRKFKNRLLTPGMAVMDCGCAPGAWTQVAAKLINAGGSYSDKSMAGLIIGCDLLFVDPIEGASFIQSDFMLKSAQDEILRILGNRKFDLVLSDMAPNASGIVQLDHDKIIDLSYKALKFALVNSYPGSHFVTKIWSGRDRDRLLSDMSKFYSEVQLIKPKASRTDSAEIYLAGFSFKGLQK